MSASILLVDDSVTIRRYARSILERMDEAYEIVERENGALALNWLSSLILSELPSLIVIDRNMPVMSGDECVRVIKMDEDWESIPLLFLTAQADQEKVTVGKNFLGADAYMCKPFKPDEFQTQVRRLISNSQAGMSTNQVDGDASVGAQQSLIDDTIAEELEDPIMGLFLTETNEHLVQLNDGLKDMLAGVDQEHLELMGRGVHSIKGAAGIVGLSDVARLAGSLESYFKKIQKAPNLWESKHLAILGEALQLLTTIATSSSEDIRASEVERAADFESIKSQLDAVIVIGDKLSESKVKKENSNAISTEFDQERSLKSRNKLREQATSTSYNFSRASSKEFVVLLIDDQQIIGESVRAMLEDQKDIVFHFCQNPAAAIATATELQPTVILQDLVMPEIDGLELVRRFRANKNLSAVPLIVLSGTEEAEVKAEAFALGANDYMVKLPNALEVIARIRYHSQAYINLLEREAAMARVTWLAEHDPLTGCLNRRTWHEQLEVEISKDNKNRFIGIAICDIDFFKRVNDTYGHQCGDEAIKHVVELIEKGIEGKGRLGRLGGEEFGIFIVIEQVEIGSKNPLQIAESILESIRSTLEQTPLSWKEHVLNLTISIGVSMYSAEENLQDALSRADNGVYQAKESGRNRVAPI